VAVENTRINVDHRWRQGSVLPVELASKVVAEARVQAWEADDLVLVISQDCDVVNSSLALEPYVEVHFARAIGAEDRDGRYANGHNPRVLQFSSAASGVSQLYKVNIQQKFCAPRATLVDGIPRFQLEPEVRDLIARWTAKRYTRPAFPDAFNERLKPKRNQLERVLQANGHLISAVYLRLDPFKELGPDEVYRGLVRVTALSEVLADDEAELAAVKAAADLEATLSECRDLDLEVDLVSEDEFSIHDFRLMRKWDFDFISDSLDDAESIPPPL
jgi:hypothetical protein